MTTPGKKKPLTVPLPEDATDAIYYCRACSGKATFGRAYFDEVGEPDTCPNCGTAYETTDQRERIHRLTTDTDESLVAKRDALRKARADRQTAAEGRQRPADPRSVRQQRIEELRRELEALEAADAADAEPAVPGATPVPILPSETALRERGIQLGP